MKGIGPRFGYYVALVLALGLSASCSSRVQESELGISAASPASTEEVVPSAPAATPDAGIGSSTDIPAAAADSLSGGTGPAAAKSPAAAAPNPAASNRPAVATPGGSVKAPTGGGASTPAQPSTGGGGGGAGSGPAASGPGAPTSQYPDAISIRGADSQGVSDTTIRLGLAAPVSGAAGFLGEAMVDAMRAYTSAVNDAGGVRGRKYQLVIVDSQFQPAIEATAIKRLVERDKVFAVFSPFGDSAAPYVTSKGIPSFGFGVTNPSFSSRYPTTYPVGHNVVNHVIAQALALVKVLKLPIKTTALVYDSQNVPLNGQVKYFVKAWESLGVQVKSVDTFNLSEGDCTQLVLKIKNLGVDFWHEGNTLGWPLCLQAMKRQNYVPPLGHGGTFSQEHNFIAQAGRGADDIYGSASGIQIAREKGGPSWMSDGSKAPLVDRFIAEVQKYSPSSGNVAGLETLWTQSFWSASRLLDEAIRRQTDAVTWDGVNKWIQSQTNWSSGIMPPMSFEPKCKISPTPYTFQWKWNGNDFEQSAWEPYGGRLPVPPEMEEAIFPGAGKCYMTAIADADKQ